MAEGEGEGLQQRDERTGRAGEAGAGAALWDGGGGGLRQRTCGGVEHGAAAAPAPSGTPGGEAGSGGNTGGRVSVRTPAPGEWLQPRRKGGAENGVGEEGMGGDGEGGRGGAPPCRPTPEALAAWPAGVRGGISGRCLADSGERLQR